MGWWKEMAGGGGRDGGKMLSVARVTFACCREGRNRSAALPWRRRRLSGVETDLPRR